MSDRCSISPIAHCAALGVALLGVAPCHAQSATSQDQATSNEAVSGDIIVTAQKKNESVLRVPVPVTSIAADNLAALNKSSLRDYFQTIPGLTVGPSVGAIPETVVVVRGISGGSFGSPTVGFTIDDVPFSYPGSNIGNIVPDLDPSEIARVEVLRGPQGTLYGASSMGGLVKYVTVEPSFAEISGRISAGVSTVAHGGDGYNLSGSLNLPLTSDLAIRVNGFNRIEPGYIDNLTTGRDDVNRTRTYGGHASLLYRPASNLTIRLGALYQKKKSDGLDEIQTGPGVGRLQQTFYNGVGPLRVTPQSYSANVTWLLGPVELYTVSGYRINKFYSVTDLGAPSLTQDAYGVTGNPLVTSGTFKQFSQELRARISLSTKLEWLIGGFYEDNTGDFRQQIFATDPTTGRIVAKGYDAQGPQSYREYAVFTDLTYHLTERFEIQVGGRNSWISQTDGPSTTYLPLFAGGDQTISTSPKQYLDKNSAFTYLVTPAFHVTDATMIYGRFASGYRPGGGSSAPNNPCVTFNFQCTFSPDKTQNYEIGLKGRNDARTVAYDLSVFKIDWDRFQLSQTDVGSHFGYTTNAGAAGSYGVEAALTVKPWDGMQVDGFVTWAKATLTKDFPATSSNLGKKGDRLPFSSRVTGHVAAEQKVDLTGEVSGFGGVTVNYLGRRLGSFVPAGSRAVYPAYWAVDLHAGVDYRAFVATLSVSNLTDHRGFLGGGAGSFPDNAFTITRPRTIALTVSKSF